MQIKPILKGPKIEKNCIISHVFQMSQWLLGLLLIQIIEADAMALQWYPYKWWWWWYERYSSSTVVENSAIKEWRNFLVENFVCGEKGKLWEILWIFIHFGEYSPPLVVHIMFRRFSALTHFTLPCITLLIRLHTSNKVVMLQYFQFMHRSLQANLNKLINAFLSNASDLHYELKKTHSWGVL